MGRAEALLARVATRPPGVGSTRVVCVDGPAGSGKSTLAAELVAAARAAGTEVALVAMDDLYDGWDGLAAAPATVAEDLLAPLADGRPAGYRRYDWHEGRFGTRVEVPAVPLLVLEGVGCWSPAYADRVALLVWVEAPPAVRRQRGLARDGEAVLPHWDAWVAAEDHWHATHRTREAADVVVTTA